MLDSDFSFDIIDFDSILNNNNCQYNRIYPLPKQDFSYVNPISSPNGNKSSSTTNDNNNLITNNNSIQYYKVISGTKNFLLDIFDKLDTADDSLF